MVGVYWQYDGELDKAIPYCQEALEIASEIKEETVYGLCLLSQALDIILRDGDYDQARALIDKGYPPNSPFDLRMIVSITAKVYLVCISQNSADMKQMIGGVY
ncbi:MAG TPA: tetratricopeptide repeat protein, partial [Aggregatilineales bacterium]|nr:tetratricopeptide repeat protein [Aggregatilineales bacterium]